MTEQNRTLYRGSIEEDLRPLSALLWHREVAHRVVEDNGEQVIELARDDQMDEARDMLRRWRSGEIKVELRQREAPDRGAFVATLAAAPITSALIILGTLGFLLVSLGDAAAVSLLDP